MNPPRPELLALLRAVKEDPEDDAPRLVFADWLEEHGEPDRADLIRLQCELSATPHGDPSRKELARREQEVLRRHRDAFLGPLNDLAGVQNFCRDMRGLVGLTVSDARKFVSGQIPPLAGSEALAWVGKLYLCVQRPTADHFRALAGWAGLADVPELSVLGYDPAPGGPSRGLDRATDAEIALLAQSPNVAGLVTLKVTTAALGETALRSLGSSPHLVRLRRLALFDCQLGDAALVRFAESSLLGQLERLELAGNRLGDAGVTALARSPACARLTRLLLWSNHAVGDAAAAALANSPHMANLTELDLRYTAVGDAGALALAKSPHFTKLGALRLSGERIGEAGRAALRSRFGDRVST